MAEKLFRAEVEIGKAVVTVSGGSLTRPEAERIAVDEAAEYRKLGYKNAKSKISRDENPAKWRK